MHARSGPRARPWSRNYIGPRRSSTRPIYESQTCALDTADTSSPCTLRCDAIPTLCHRTLHLHACVCTASWTGLCPSRTLSIRRPQLLLLELAHTSCMHSVLINPDAIPTLCHRTLHSRMRLHRLPGPDSAQAVHSASGAHNSSLSSHTSPCMHSVLINPRCIDPGASRPLCYSRRCGSIHS